MDGVRNDADLDALLPRLHNWGRWGDGDQLGTLNHLGDAQRRAAAGLVTAGRVVPLAREVSPARTEGLREPVYEMLRDGEVSRDRVGMVFHGFALTHLDALCHVATPDGRLYNGVPADVLAPSGAQRLGVEVMAERGIAGRGVLLDIAALRGAPLEPGTAISPGDLEAAERAQGVQVGEGDLLLVRTGAGLRNTRERRAGLHPACLPWLHARRVALLGADGDNDVHPPPPGFVRWASAMHAVAIPYLGLPLLDNAELDALAVACAEQRRWAFLLTIAPWRLQGTTSSPVTPLAVL